MTLRILQFGATGQVAREMSLLGGSGVTIEALSRQDVDLEDAGAVGAAISTRDFDVLVNAAAYTAVDAAETDEARAFAVNAAAPGAMALASAAKRRPIIHLSTDYVFDGAKAGAYVETDPTGPTGAYGRTKLAGEQAVAGANPRHVIIRTAWVYSAHGKNFVKTMLRLGSERDTLGVVDDQRGCPTSAGDIAAAVVTVAKSLANGDEHAGIYHFAGEGATSWHGFAEAIFEDAAEWSGARPIVKPIRSSEFPTPAKRPANSQLNCARIHNDFRVETRPWRDGLGDVLAQLKTHTRG